MSTKTVFISFLVLILLAFLLYFAYDSNAGGLFRAAIPTASQTNTPTSTNTATPTNTPTSTFIPTMSPTSTATLTPTATQTPTCTPTATNTLAPLWTPTKKPNDGGNPCEPWPGCNDGGGDGDG